MDKVTKVMSVSMITNTFLSIIKIITGFLSNSSALIADGIHSFSDLSTDMVAVIGNYLSRKPADEKHPYGHGKIEYITSIIISFVILILGISIIYGSIKKEIIIPSMIAAIISMITIVAKLLLSKYIIKKGKEYQSNILLASGYESSTDVISSIVVLISVVLMQLGQIISIFRYADIIASILVGLLIVRIGFEILKENMSHILEEQETNPTYLKLLKELILETEDITHVDHLMVLKYGFYYKLIAEVSVDAEISVKKAHEYIHQAENRLKKFDPKIIYVTIHINPSKDYHLIKATKKDLKQINQYRLETIITESSPNEKEQNRMIKYIQKTLKEHILDYYMIIVDNKKIGTVGYYEIEANTIFIEELFIEKSYRHQQIGTSILQKIKKQYKNQILMLWVYKNNSVAISLYKHLGFKQKEETQERIKMTLDNTF